MIPGLAAAVTTEVRRCSKSIGMTIPTARGN